MKLTKEIVLKGLDKIEITFTILTLLSEWDLEQVDSIYLEQFEIKGKKAAVKRISGDLVVKRRDKLLEVMVKNWSRKEKITPLLIKKALSRIEFQKLTDEIEAVYDKATPSKKNTTKS